MNFSTINEQALITAATAVVGPQATNAILALYLIIDKAQYDGYQLGKLDGERNMDEATKVSFDNGWQYGEAEGRAEELADMAWKLNDANDDGYIAGVRDARANPTLADANVADIVADLDQEAINGEYDADNVQDSGDAQVWCTFCQSYDCVVGDPITE